jgi:hypothetical protein
MILKFTDVADPPNVIANSVGFLVGPIEFLAGNVLTELNRFEYRATTEATVTNVVIDFGDCRTYRIPP